MTDVRDRLDADDRAALALELALAAKASAPLRRPLAALTAALLVEAAKAKAASPDGTIPPEAADRIRAILAAQLAALSIDVAASVTAATAAGVRLALKQEKAVLADLGVTVPDADAVTAAVLADPVMAAAAPNAEDAFAAELDRIGVFADASPLRTEAQVRDLAARAGGAARIVERDVRTATNRAINTTAVQIVQDAAAAPAVLVPETPFVPRVREPLETRILRRPDTDRTPLGPQLRVVWVAERGACLTCLALSGQVADPTSGVGFDEFATFDKHPMPVWPPGQPLMGPPRHPHCRCRIRIIAASNTMVPAALVREARRSVARGWSDHASLPARLTAADRLLATVNGLPITVQRRAATDVARGGFSTRHRPRRPELRADKPRTTSPEGTAA